MFLKRALALFIVSVMLILPLVSCVDESIISNGSDKASQSVDTEKDTEAATDKTKESEKATENTNNGELNNGNNNSVNNENN